MKLNNFKDSDKKSASKNLIAKSFFVILTVITLLLFLIIGIASLITGHNYFSDPFTTHFDDFSQEQLEWLKNEYSISIPESAVFVEGYQLFSPDSWYVAEFYVPIDKFDEQATYSSLAKSIWGKDEFSRLPEDNFVLTEANNDSDIGYSYVFDIYDNLPSGIAFSDPIYANYGECRIYFRLYAGRKY